MKFPSISADNDLYLKLISAFEVAFEIDYKKLIGIIFRLAFGRSIITWVYVRWRYNRLQEDSAKIANSKFRRMLEGEIDKFFAAYRKKGVTIPTFNIGRFAGKGLG